MAQCRLVGCCDLLEPLAIPSHWPVPQIKRTADRHALCKRNMTEMPLCPMQWLLYVQLPARRGAATALRDKTGIDKNQATTAVTRGRVLLRASQANCLFNLDPQTMEARIHGES